MYGSDTLVLFNDVTVSLESDNADNSSDSLEEIEGSEDRQGDPGVQSDNGTDNDSDLRDSELHDLDLSNVENNQALIISQIDNLNENVVTLQSDNKLTVTFLFVVIVILMVQLVYKLFYKVLGLGQI